jgi:probable F420-dependent oxidoreductase
MSHSRRFRFGIQLANVTDPDQWSNAARKAEDLGYSTLFVPDHFGALPGPVPALMAAADATTTLRVGTLVFDNDYYHPVVLARDVATLDVLSGGRVELGIGASWLKEEWDATGLDFHTRGRRVDETIDVCRRLWTEDVIEHHGEFFDFQPVMFNPKPIQQPIPIVVGGDSPAAKRRAALRGEGWIPMNTSIDDLRAAVDEVNKMRADAGRPGTIEVTLGGNIQSADDVKRYEDAGADRVFCTPFTSSREAIDGIRRFGDEVLSQL